METVDTLRGPALLEVEDVEVVFGGVHAVAGISFTAEPGSIVGLIGPNGSGKTTTLDAISGNVPLAAGTIKVDGDVISDYLPEERIRLGLVRSFQDCRLFPELTVEEVLMVCEDARDPVSILMSTAQAPWARAKERRKREAVAQVIESFGLARFARHKASELSTGTRRVVDLASIVLASPRLLLLDEPTAGIAQREAEAFVPLLQRLHEVADCTIVLVEHDVSLVFDLCSKVVVMETGELAAEGTPDEVSRNPRALAAYLGASSEALAASGSINIAGVEEPSVPAGGEKETVDDEEVENIEETHAQPMPSPDGADDMSGPGGPSKTPLGRSYQRFRRRPAGAQAVAVLVVLALIAGVVALVVTGGNKKTTTNAPGTQTIAALLKNAPTITSARGITGNTIKVVFPVLNLNSNVGKQYLARTKEFSLQRTAINLYVTKANKSGELHGKKIKAEIETITPKDPASIEADCKKWTTPGSPTAAFAVLDGLPTWTGTNQLCLTKYGHTPFIGQWTTVTTWTKEGAPYLFWTGTDISVMLKAVVAWGIKTHLLGGSNKVGVITGNTASDQAQLNKYLLPYLKEVGVPTPTLQTIPAAVTTTQNISTQASIIVQKLKGNGITSVIPLIGENDLGPILEAEQAQGFDPKLLLSDDWTSIDAALGYVTIFPKVMNGQYGVTAETLGGFDNNHPQATGGYDKGVRTCYKEWNKFHPKPNFPTTTARYNFIEEQGPVQAWCSDIRLFAKAVTKAGPSLTRKTFVEGMWKIKHFPGGIESTWSFGPHKYFASTKYRIVQVWVNTPPSSKCDVKTTGGPQGTCWIPVGGYLTGFKKFPTKP